ncbi:ThiF family adenylyltransferase [Streptomyces sp. NPDC050564]|uniref:HesA/MoeB/ThiF family protein n=1 Tax=Streptomyces sp. NPDC050564 TaxID=3365631 RepID=UPI0037B6A876
MTVTVEALSRPRIKPEHRAYRTVDGNVRIGSVIHGIGAEIADPQGWVWTLVEAMDGTRGPSAVVAEVVRTHPGLPGEDARQAMADLLAAGFVDDAGAAVPVPERERVRYSRGVPLLRWMDLGPRTSPWDAQLRLRRAHVLLIGIGGTGGYAAQSLVASGVGHLHCVDPDVVDLSNLNRQPLFRESDIGRPKVEAALSTLRALNSDVTITGEQREVTGPEDLAELVRAGGRAGGVDAGPDTSGPGRGGLNTSGRATRVPDACGPATGGPDADAPGRGEPGTGGPGTDGPGTGGPGTGGPGTGGPGTGGPSTTGEGTSERDEDGPSDGGRDRDEPGQGGPTGDEPGNPGPGSAGPNGTSNPGPGSVGGDRPGEALGRGYDLLVLAADRPDDIRRWANRACLAAGLPWVDAGYRGPLVTAGVYVPGRGACWECLRAGEAARRDLRLGSDQDPEVASPRMPWNPATAVTAGLSGGLLAHAALALLTGVPALDPGFRFGVNLMLPGDPVLQRTPRHLDCPVCGERAGGVPE